MSIVVRIVQALLILAGLVACAIAVAFAVETFDDVDARCYLTEVQDPAGGGYRDVPSPGCGTVAVLQTQAISAAAVGLVGIGAMVGAAALNGMVQPRPRQAAQPAPAPYGYGPPSGPQPYPPGPYGPPTA
ncbi:hypothetical protein [Actinokineospora sp. NPDC004072]